MKILQAISYYAPAWGYGGPPRVMYELARRHQRNGHEVTVFTTDAFEEHARIRESEAEIEGIRIRRFKNLSNRLAWRYKKFLAPEFGRALSREVDRFDVIHVSDSRGWLTLNTYKQASRAGVPLVLSAFGTLGSGNGTRSITKRLYDRRYLEPMIRSAAALVAQTSHEADTYRSFGADSSRIAQIPLGVSLTEFKALPERGGFRRVNGLGEDEKIVLFIGRIHALKGLDFLVEVIDRLRTADDRWRLVIVGVDNGALPQLLAEIERRGLTGRVLFPGPLYGTDRLQLMVDADVFAITPAFYEETSLAALEAAAAGLPVVATQESEIPGLTSAGGGFIVPRQFDAVAAALASVVVSREHARAVGARARKLVFEKHSWDAITSQFEDLFLRVARH